MPAQASRWLALDGLRGLAVTAVVLFHLGLATRGYLGVDVFFVLSGFLITRLLVAELERADTISRRRFYVRRLLRLYPAFAVVVGCCVVVAVLTRRAVPAMLHDAAASLLYVSNLTGVQGGLLDHTWSLSLEEQFYLLWPVLLLFRWRRRHWTGWLPALVVLVAVLAADLATHQRGAFHSYVRAMGLPLGCLVALLPLPTLTRIGRAGPVALAVLAVCFFAPLPAALTTAWPVSIGALLAAPVTAWLVTAGNPLLESGPLRWLGTRSYSLYLWHFPILSLTGHHAPAVIPHPAALAIGTLASLVAAEASYRFVETPINRFRDRRLKAPSAVTAEPTSSHTA